MYVAAHDVSHDNLIKLDNSIHVARCTGDYIHASNAALKRSWHITVDYISRLPSAGESCDWWTHGTYDTDARTRGVLLRYVM